MIALLIFMSILSILSIGVAAAACYIVWRTVSAYLAAEAQKEQYHSFMSLMIDRIQEDSAVFRSELARRMGTEIAEVREMNHLLRNLEGSMVSFRSTLVEFLAND